MAEAESVLIETAYRLVTLVGRTRGEKIAIAPERCLDHHRDRLRLLLASVLGRTLRLRVAESPAPGSALARLLGRLPRALEERRPLPGSDGVDLFLPTHLEPEPGLPAARLFRVLALLHGRRTLRLAGLATPPPGLRQTLFILSEAVAAERDLVAELPALAPDLAALRGTTLAGRPALGLLRPQERAVEHLYRQALAGQAGLMPEAPEAVDSLAWAEKHAGFIESIEGPFRRLPGNLWSGVMLPRPANMPAAPPPVPGEQYTPPKVGRMRRRPQVRRPVEQEEDDRPGPWMIQSDDPLEHAEDPMGLRRLPDQDSPDPDGLGDSLSELPEAALVVTPEQPRELLLSDDRPDPQAAVGAEQAADSGGLQYPEWDFRRAAYSRAAAWIQVRAAPGGNPGWAEAVLQRLGPLLAEVRRRFERLRPQRQSLRRQPDGDEIDLEACVSALADRRGGAGGENRLYRADRPARRSIAVGLLVDASGSTDAWVEGNRRIIDVEKEALLVVGEALCALGAPYAIDAFSGEGQRGVVIWPVKGFAEGDQSGIRGRIGSLEPDRHTRVGAALRHATAALTRRPEAQRLLLLLSDGKPNDIDRYAGRYGVEDMRRAVIEARSAGIHCFCLTVDRAAPHYLSHVFGPGGYTLLRHPARLPAALIEVLRHMLAR